MRKINRTGLLATVLATFLFTLVALASIALAGSPQASPRQEILERLGQNQQRRDELRERIATRAAQLRHEQVERLKRVFNRILDRYSAALGRLDKIVRKLERRIDKLEARGVDTSRAETALAGCQSKKNVAEEAIADSRAKVDAIDANSSTVREAVKTAVEALHSSKGAIRNYHKCLVEVTRILKAAKPKEGTESAE